MKRMLLAALVAASSLPGSPGAGELPKAKPATPVTTPARPPVLDDAAWREVAPDNLVLIDTKYGETAVELAPDFAPNHVKRLRALIRAGFYDGTSFYRVIDGFVAQGGIGEGTASTAADGKADDPRRASWPPLKREFDRPLDKSLFFTPLGNPDPFAAEVGHVKGFPVGRDPEEKRMWIIHCPGTFAFARDNDGDTATTEFYIVIGEAPRRLDRNLTAFGRVIDGMEFLQKLQRGDPAVDNGVIADKNKADKILSMRLASDLPADQRPHFQVLRTAIRTFERLKDTWRNPAPGFYVRTPPPILDICLKPVPSRRVAHASPAPLAAAPIATAPIATAPIAAPAATAPVNMAPAAAPQEAAAPAATAPAAATTVAAPATVPVQKPVVAPATPPATKPEESAAGIH